MCLNNLFCCWIFEQTESSTCSLARCPINYLFCFCLGSENLRKKSHMKKIDVLSSLGASVPVFPRVVIAHGCIPHVPCRLLFSPRARRRRQGGPSGVGFFPPLTPRGRNLISTSLRHGRRRGGNEIELFFLFVAAGSQRGKRGKKNCHFFNSKMTQNHRNLRELSNYLGT